MRDKEAEMFNTLRDETSEFLIRLACAVLYNDKPKPYDYETANWNIAAGLMIIATLILIVAMLIIILI